MSRKRRKNAEKGWVFFFVVLASLFAFFAGVKVVQYFDGRSRPSTSETASGETQTAATTAATTTTTSSTTTTTSAATTTSTTTAASSGTTTAQASSASVTQSSGEKVIYLTFDDGPTDNTENIMDVLERYDVRGTFFVIHSYDGCEKQLREMHDRGHCVALHTYSHSYSIYRSQETYFEDLGKISDLVYNATGERSKLVRFPGGSSNTISRKYKKGIMTTLTQELPKRGYAYFDWNVDSADASAVHVPADKIVRNSTTAIGKKNQVILLMHDAKAKTSTVDALPDIVKAYRDAGYRFDVLSEDSFTWHHRVQN